MSEFSTAEGDFAKVDWLRAREVGFGSVAPEQELPHSDVGTQAFSATETWWFEVSDPKSGLIASFYIARRPNLGICSAGTWMWRGIRREQILADHLNYQIYLPSPQIDGQVLSVPQVGLSYDLVEPFRRTLVRYDPPGLDAHAELEFTALMPPAVRANGKHFEQSLWVKGEIALGGERFPIDCAGFRDRSWGEARPEDHVVHPPIGWLCGTIEDGRMAFNLSGCDDARHTPALAGTYGLDAGASFYDGWLWIDGELRKVVGMSKRTERLADERMRPVRIEAEFTDDRGEAHRLVGTPRSAMWMHHWPNLNAWFAFTDWELDGRKGYGEAQDYAWPHYAKTFWR